MSSRPEAGRTGRCPVSTTTSVSHSSLFTSSGDRRFSARIKGHRCQKSEDRRQRTKVRGQRKEGERLGRSEGEKKTAIPGPDRICKGCAYTLVLIKHYDLVVYYQSSRARAGRNRNTNYLWPFTFILLPINMKL